MNTGLVFSNLFGGFTSLSSHGGLWSIGTCDLFTGLLIVARECAVLICEVDAAEGGRIF